MMRSIEQFLSITVAACAIVATALMLRREIVPAKSSQALTSPVANWAELVDSPHVLGATGAKVRLVMFADFQCPACRHFALHTWPAVERRFSGDVALVFRHWPLDYHPHARPAGLAAACAADQQRFMAMHDLLYHVTDSLGRISWEDLALRAGVTDIASFNTCLGSSAANQQVDNDIALVAALGGTGTPTILLNGRLYASPPDSVRLIREIERLLE